MNKNLLKEFENDCLNEYNSYIHDYVKKPIKIRAMQYNEHLLKPLRSFVNSDCLEIVFECSTMDCSPTIYIRTLEGRMLVSEGDYVIEGVNGEFYPCKPDIFEKTYEKIMEDE